MKSSKPCFILTRVVLALAAMSKMTFAQVTAPTSCGFASVNLYFYPEVPSNYGAEIRIVGDWTVYPLTGDLRPEVTSRRDPSVVRPAYFKSASSDIGFRSVAAGYDMRFILPDGSRGDWVICGIPNTNVYLMSTTTTTTPMPLENFRSSAAYGDPHFKTWTGYSYEYHGQCDLVLLHSGTFGKDGRGIDIHIRTEIRGSWSFIKNAIVKIGQDTLELESGGNYYLNGQYTTTLPPDFAGYRLTTRSAAGSTRIEIQVGHPDEPRDLHFGTRGLLVLREFKDWVSVTVTEGANDYFGDSVGMLGEYNSGERRRRDGELVIGNDHNSFGQEWQVRDFEPKLFRTVDGPQFPQRCALPDAAAAGTSRRLRGSKISHLEAEKACMELADRLHSVEDCIYDVMATGDLSMAEAGAF